MRRANRKLTDEQAREIRLSLEPHFTIAPRYGVSASVVESLRFGQTYGPLAWDEREAQRKRLFDAEHPDRFRLHESLLAVGRIQVMGLHDMDRQEAMDAAHECRHGRLSHDPSPACGCWRGELAPVIQLPLSAELEAVA